MWIQHESHHVGACYASKDLENYKKGLITFMTFNCIFLCKRGFHLQKGLKFSRPLESCNNLISMFIASVIDVVKASNNN